MSAREIALEGTFNLRDLGGYATADGRTVRWRTLLRGAGLNRLAGGDARTVARLGLRTVVDLRTEGELERRGAFPVDALPARVLHLPMIANVWDHADLHEGEPPEAFLLRRYAEMLDEGRDTVATVLELLAVRGSLPLAFYCAAGKDRTGVLAAIVLGVLGVPDEAIVDDYRLSREPVERMVARARARREAASTMVDQPSALMAAPPAAMRLLLGRMRERFGSITGYAAALGAGPEAVEAIRVNLLEPRPT